MVVRPAPNAASGCHLKSRDSESMEGVQSWESPPDVFTVESRSTIHIPYQHYALVYLDSSGNIRYELPPSMEDHKSEIFVPDFEKRFLQHAAQAIFPGQLNINPTFSPKSRRPRYLSCRRDMPAQKRKRLEYSVNTPSEDEDDDDFEGHPVNKIGLPIGDEEKMLAYYAEAFRAFQQINCRQVAKAYIKLIEPRKQAKHPYNGGKAAPGETKDPEKTKPEWWPADVIHKEPDHLKKIPRVKLLIHIFRNLSKSHGITARKLKAAGEEAQKQCRPAEKASVLDEIYRVREEEERYERGEIDADTLVYVVKREKTNRCVREDPENESDSEQPGYIDEPSNSGEGHVSEMAGSNRPQNNLQMPPHTLPMHNRVVPTFAETRTSIFSPSISGPFETGTPNSLSPMAIKSDYEEFTPMGSPISVDTRATPSNVNYFQGLPQSPVDGQYMNPRGSVAGNQAAGNYGAWPATSFQHPIFNQVEYASGTPGMIPQQFMSPMMPSSHATLPVRDLQETRSQPQAGGNPMFHPSFRTDS
ncbi:hypothetical protein GX51_04901 [Blastomyces parvus]|uniref:Subtelomeric hrmA-associated cluster protein AFUB-079030/YDR124W-like helical bundle domain-containing protein n=1 Tax=Blastomyces parvus TaxID=2060905 RepID=A0A2B7WZE6_9EURO|nr:hypothetical protein GX51_04901 [Blastomyces parvus]